MSSAEMTAFDHFSLCQRKWASNYGGIDPSRNNSNEPLDLYRGLKLQKVFTNTISFAPQGNSEQWSLFPLYG